VNSHMSESSEKPVQPEENERQFLHDLATPLTTAFFILDVVLDDLQKESPPHSSCPRLAQAYAAVEKIRILLQNRRKVLIEQGVPSART